MDNPERDCGKLLQVTVNALTEDRVARMFLQTQRTNIGLAAQQSIRRSVIQLSRRPESTVDEILVMAASFIPHFTDRGKYGGDFYAFYDYGDYDGLVLEGVKTALRGLALKITHPLTGIIVVSYLATASFFRREDWGDDSLVAAVDLVIGAMDRSKLIDRVQHEVDGTFVGSSGSPLGLAETEDDTAKLLNILALHEQEMIETGQGSERLIDTGHGSKQRKSKCTVV